MMVLSKAWALISAASARTAAIAGCCCSSLDLNALAAVYTFSLTALRYLKRIPEVFV